MISRAHRFRGRKSINQVYKHGVSSSGGLFALKVLKTNNPRGYRLAVVVSKKVSKSAVVRNRIRRRVYSLMQQIGPNIQNPCDIVITVYKQELKDEPQASLKDQLQVQLSKSGASIKS